MPVEKLIITTQQGNETQHVFIPVIENAAGDFFPCELKDSFYAKGASCEVFIAEGEDGRRYLIKQYKQGYGGSESHSKISAILRRFTKQGDNYILNDIYTGVGHLENDETWRNYEVFEYKNGAVLSKKKREESIFANVNKLYSALLDFLSVLDCLKRLHADVDGDSFIHGDIKMDNFIVIRLNGRRVAQFIDVDSVKSKREIVASKAGGTLFYELIQTTSVYYDEDDIKYFCSLSTQDLERFVFILDTTAATRMLSEILVANADFELSAQDEASLKNSALRTALNEFFDKGMRHEFAERFLSVDEMRYQISSIIAAISDRLPTNVRTEKLKAMSQNNTINRFADVYIKKHRMEEKSRSEISISEMLNDICQRFLPSIRIEESGSILHLNGEETPLAQLLANKKNFFISAPAGYGKTYSFIYEFLKNIHNINDELLCVYVSLDKYSPKETTLIEYISERSGFPIYNLLENGEKILLLLDAYDEAAEYCLKEDKNPQNIKGDKNPNSIYKNLSEKFIEHLEELRRVEAIIISSRFEFQFPEERQKNLFANTFSTATFLPLSEEQKQNYLPSGLNDYENEKQLFNILENPLFLTIYRELLICGNKASPANQAELIEVYLKSLFEQEHGVNAGGDRIFDEVIEYIANFDDVNRSYCVEKQAKCFSSIVDFIEHKHEHYTGCICHIGHRLFANFFLACEIKGRIDKICVQIWQYDLNRGKRRNEKYYKNRSEERKAKRKILTEISGLFTTRKVQERIDNFEEMIPSPWACRGRFDDFFYLCLSHLIKKDDDTYKGNMCISYLDRMYHLAYSEYCLNDDESIAPVCRELFYVISAYKSLELGRQTYDLKYSRDIPVLKKGFSAKDKFIANCIAVWSTAFIMMLGGCILLKHFYPILIWFAACSAFFAIYKLINWMINKKKIKKWEQKKHCLTFRK